MRQTVDAFSGAGGSPLLYRDEKRFGLGPLLYVRARQTFN